MKRKPGRAHAYHDGKIHLCRQMCDTCIFRPGNLMDLAAGRRAQMEADAVAADTAIICHATLGTDHPAVCRGFLNEHGPTFPIRLAAAFGRIELIAPKKTI